MKHYSELCKYLSSLSSDKTGQVKEILSFMKEAEIFCIQPSASDKQISIEKNGAKHEYGAYEDELDSPFQTIWIECSDVNGEESPLTHDFHTTTNSLILTYGILIHEVKPKNFRIWTYYKINTYDDSTKSFKYNKAKVFETCMIGPIAEYYISRINKEAWGVENPHEVLKIGSGKSKEIKRIRRVIHIAPKQVKNKIAIGVHKKIDWSHSWTVRGHWRKINGIGKDRNNQELVYGYTWVNSYLKGNGELVKKARIVKNTP